MLTYAHTSDLGEQRAETEAEESKQTLYLEAEEETEAEEANKRKQTRKDGDAICVRCHCSTN